MVSWFGSVLSLIVGAAEPSLAPGMQLHYQGTVAQVQSDRSAMAAEKSYDLTFFVTRGDADGVEFYWLLDDRGAGGFGWFDRVGRGALNAGGAIVGQGPALLYDYGKGKHVIATAIPRFVLPEGVDVGKKWERDGLEYEVVRSTSVVERPAWQIEARNQFGPKSRVWVDKDSHVVLQQDERVFMNQGTEYRSALQLKAVDRPADDEAAKLQTAFAALVGLKGKVKRSPRLPDDAWSAEQLQLLAKHLPEAKADASAGGLERIVAAAERDLRRLTDRSNALDEIVAKQTGRTVEPFQVEGLSGAKLGDRDLRGAVTVLHFWDYRDEPLKEPYGQVGYLEFLFARHQKAGLKVYGVAVDGRFQQEAGAKAAVAGVRKLKSFMNLSYPIVFDGGDLVRQFGDPRLVGGELPLFVVVGRDGKIAHYKVGYYAVDRETGLKELDAAVTKLLPVGEAAGDAGRR